MLALSAGRSIDKLESQIREFHPRLAAVWEEDAARDLAVRISDTDTQVVCGMEGLLELARMPETELLVTAIVGDDRDSPHHGGHTRARTSLLQTKRRW